MNSNNDNACPYSPAEVDALEDQIAPLLHGRHPALQGAVLACLLARWLAGHEPTIRNEILAIHLRSLNELVQLYAQAIWGRLDD